MRNPGFERFHRYIYYDPEEEIWQNAHSFKRMAVEAPPEYHQWLRKVQDHSEDWKYADQTCLGLHGMHHTPSVDCIKVPPIDWEFNYIDPAGDSLRFVRIVEDLELMGLDYNRVFTMFRFPGHKHTESVVPTLFRNNVRIIDGSPIYDMTSDFGRIFRHNKFIWHVNSVSWFDNANFYMNDFLENSLNRGYFCLTGVHFHFLGARTEGYYETALNLFAWLEYDYPYLHWFLGDELADYWDELSTVRNVHQTGSKRNLQFCWDGANTTHQTLLVMLASDSLNPVECVVDGIPVDAEKRGRRVFVQLPVLPEGSHQMNMRLSYTNAPSAELSSDYLVEYQSNRGMRLKHFFAETSTINFEVFDVTGRKLFSSGDMLIGQGTVDVHLPLDRTLAAGNYFLRINSNERTVVKRMIVSN